jgi:hypothetical protein
MGLTIMREAVMLPLESAVPKAAIVVPVEIWDWLDADPSPAV